MATTPSCHLFNGVSRSSVTAQADPTAFAALYRRYLPGIYSYIRVRTQREEDAIDLTQQVFLRALAALPGYRQRGVPFSAWLYRITRNVVTDFHRRHRTTVAWTFVDTNQPEHNAVSIVRGRYIVSIYSDLSLATIVPLADGVVIVPPSKNASRRGVPPNGRHPSRPSLSVRRISWCSVRPQGVNPGQSSTCTTCSTSGIAAVGTVDSVETSISPRQV